MCLKQPLWTQTFLSWSPLWIIEVMVAMFRLVQVFFHAPVTEGSLGNWLQLCLVFIRTADTGYVLLVT